MSLKLSLRILRNLAQIVWLRLPNVHYTSDVKVQSDISRDIKVGKYSYIAKGATIGSKLSIGNYVMIATDFSVVGGDHNYKQPGTPMVFSGRSTVKPTVIMDDVWIGHRVILMHGVTVGTGAIVAAGSVVTRSIPPCQIWGGVPAEFIRNRFSCVEDEKTHMAKIENTSFSGFPPK